MRFRERLADSTPSQSTMPNLTLVILRMAYLWLNVLDEKTVQKTMNSSHTLAYEAMKELNNLLSLTQCKPGGPDAFNEFCELGLPVIVCDSDAARACGAIDGVVRFKVNEALVRHMAAFIAP